MVVVVAILVVQLHSYMRSVLPSSALLPAATAAAKPPATLPAAASTPIPRTATAEHPTSKHPDEAVSRSALVTVHTGPSEITPGADSGRAAARALSDDDVVVQFANASFIRKEAAAFERKCHRYRERWRALTRTPAFARLDRVLVIDVTAPHWNGLGNSMDRWLNLLRLGHAHGRATFLRMDPCSPPAPAHAGMSSADWDAKRPATSGCTFDLGTHFEADEGWGWAWDAKAAARVRAAMERGMPAQSGEAQVQAPADEAARVAGDGARGFWPARVLRYRCLAQSWTCLNGSFVDGASQKTLVPWVEEMKEGQAAAKLFGFFDEADRAAEAEGRRRVAAASGAAAAGVGSPAAPAADMGSTKDRTSAAVLAPASVVVLELVNEQTSLQQETMHSSVREMSLLYAQGGLGMCERHSLTRPKVALQRVLLPALRKLEGAEVALTMHVRTGFADWQKYAPRMVLQAQARAAALAAAQRKAHYGGSHVGAAAPAPVSSTGLQKYVPPSHSRHWAELERLLLDCTEAQAAAAPINATGAAQHLPPPFCFLYRMGPPPFIERRSANAVDAARCALPNAEPVEALQPPRAALLAAQQVMAALPATDALPTRRGPLAATIACAAMHGRRIASVPAWAIDHLSSKTFTKLPASTERSALPERVASARAALDRAVSDAEADARWRLIVLGDAPAVHAVVSGAPYLRSRAVSLEFEEGSGGLGHTVFAASCRMSRGGRSAAAAAAQRPGGSRRLDARRAGADAGACVQGTDPAGAWSRSIADLYLGGLGMAMVRLLFSSYPGAVTMRSVLVEGGTQFYADYNQRSAHRDRPPTNLTAFAVLGAAGPYAHGDEG